uniref:Tetraspanin n=1 Tax=Steinernema glaseri TaxID=37863 RepID=A0A1I7Y2X1_9BILA
MTDRDEAATPYVKLDEESEEPAFRGIENKTFGMDEELDKELPKKDHLKLPSPGGFIKAGTTFEVSKSTSTSTNSINVDAENESAAVESKAKKTSSIWSTGFMNEKTSSIGKRPSFNIFNTEDILCPFGKRRHADSTGVEMSTCCLIPSKLLSLMFAAVGILLGSICVSYMIYEVQRTSRNGSNKEVIICILSGWGVYFISSIGFLYGTLCERRRFMLPHIFLSVIFCVATIGAFLSVAITMIWDVEEQVERARSGLPENAWATDGVHVYRSHNTIRHDLWGVVIFRLTIALSAIYQSMTCICYLKTYNYFSRLSTANHC